MAAIAVFVVLVVGWLLSGLTGGGSGSVPVGQAITPASKGLSAYSSGAAASSSAPTSSANDTCAAEVPVAEEEPLIAWQPAHQGDTGADGWKEYQICGDIVDRAIAASSDYRHVKAWDVDHGLTGSNNYRPKPTNTRAFDAELSIANAADPMAFVAVHNDGGAPSGILGEVMPGDEEGKRLCKALVSRICAETGLHDRGIREVRLYSLEPHRNKAPYRCLLEIGDNAADREFLEDPASRQKVAAAMANALRDFRF